jgi:formyl-CoA transferase
VHCIENGALKGMRVLDLSMAEAGPVCAQWLAWYGADVVRVDCPLDLRIPLEMMEIGLHLANDMNKRSIFLDYKQPEGLALLHRLVPRFDVVVENFRTGVMDGHGLGYEALKAIHPSVIYVAIKGFGTTGPYKDYGALDPIIQAASGAMSITGETEGPPLRTGYVAADHITGTVAATAILAAYVRKLRDGEGDYIEVSMQEAMLGMLRSMILIDSPNGQFMRRVGNSMGPPTNAYPCQPFGPNDWVMICSPGDKLFDRCAIAIDQPELVSDERFSSVKRRNRNRAELYEVIAAWTRERTKWEAMEIFASNGVPASAVFDIDDVRANEHVAARDAIIHVDHPSRGTYEVVNNPVRMSSTVPLKASPKYGEDTVSVLMDELGLTADQIDEFATRRVVDTRNVP